MKRRIRELRRRFIFRFLVLLFVFFEGRLKERENTSSSCIKHALTPSSTPIHVLPPPPLLLLFCCYCILSFKSRRRSLIVLFSLFSLLWWWSLSLSFKYTHRQGRRWCLIPCTLWQKECIHFKNQHRDQSCRTSVPAVNQRPRGWRDPAFTTTSMRLVWFWQDWCSSSPGVPLFPVLSVRSFGSFSFSNVIQKDSPVSTEKEGGEYRRKRWKKEEEEILQNHEAHDFLHTTHLFSSLFFLLFMPSLVSLPHATGTKLNSHTHTHHRSLLLQSLQYRWYDVQVQFYGLTGRVQFKEGIRSYIKWDLLKLRQKRLDKVRHPFGTCTCLCVIPFSWSRQMECNERKKKKRNTPGKRRRQIPE